MNITAREFNQKYPIGSLIKCRYMGEVREFLTIDYASTSQFNNIASVRVGMLSSAVPLTDIIEVS